MASMRRSTSGEIDAFREAEIKKSRGCKKGVPSLPWVGTCAGCSAGFVRGDMAA